MQRILSHNLWREISAHAAKAKRRHAAIAYVTEDLLGLKRGDVLVTDASPSAIRSGETNAKLLKTLLRRGVAVHSCASLHAKVIVLDEVAVIGSGNMSRASRSALIEAAVMTDAPTTVSAVASLIAQLVRQSPALESDAIEKLCAIEVIRRGGPTTAGNPKRRAKVVPLGHNTWLLGVCELDEDLDWEQQRLVDSTTAELAERHGRRPKAIEWIRWGGGGRFLKEGRPGDRII
jgi:phosphatidylserine/phosphatidylglycerophosphate/cardiolipin synthase-like enzyme